jgi:hypothetical protein
MPKIRFPKRERTDEPEGLPSAVRPPIEVDETPAIVKRSRRSPRTQEEAPLVLEAAPPFEPTNGIEPGYAATQQFDTQYGDMRYAETQPVPAAPPEPNIFEEEIPIRTLAELEPDTDSPIPAAPVAARKAEELLEAAAHRTTESAR